MLKIVCISDVHGRWNKIDIPKCDLLISAGDYSFVGERHMVVDFHKWLNKQDATHIISVQGNHEKWAEKNFDLAKCLAVEQCPRVHFMDEGLVEIEGHKIWCSAITPFFHNWAWNRERGEEISILITHGGPYGIGDLCENGHVGCKDLLNKIKELKQLKYHIFGHVHESFGTYTHPDFPNLQFINCANLNEKYQLSNLPIVVELNVN